MATNEYKFVKMIDIAELHKVIEPQVFKEPKEMIVWNNGNPKICKALEILPNGKIICEGHIWYNNGAFIPEAPKPCMATNRELAKWLAQGNGEMTFKSKSESDIDHLVHTSHCYEEEFADEECDKALRRDEDGSWIVVRKWDDTEWHEPDVEYMGLEE